MVRGALSGFLTSLMVGSGNERALASLFVLVGTVGGAFAGVLVPLRLALEDASAKGLRSRQVGARALVLAAVVASVTTRVVVVVSLLPLINAGAPTCIQGVARVMVEAEMLMH